MDPKIDHTKLAFGWLNALTYGPMIYDVAKAVGLLPKSLSGETPEPTAVSQPQPHPQAQPKTQLPPPVRLPGLGTRRYAGVSGGGLLPSLPTYGVAGMPKRAVSVDLIDPEMKKKLRAAEFEARPETQELLARMTPEQRDVFLQRLQPQLGDGTFKPLTSGQKYGLGYSILGQPNRRPMHPRWVTGYSPELQKELERLQAEHVGAPWPAGQYLTDPALQKEFASKMNMSWDEFEQQQRAAAGLPTVAQNLEGAQAEHRKMLQEFQALRDKTPWTAADTLIMPAPGTPEWQQLAMERLQRLKRVGLTPDSATPGQLNEAGRASTGEIQWHADPAFRHVGDVNTNEGVLGLMSQLARTPQRVVDQVRTNPAFVGQAAAARNVHDVAREQLGATPAQAATPAAEQLGATGTPPKWEPGMPMEAMFDQARQIANRNHEQLVANLVMQRARHGQLDPARDDPQIRRAYLIRSLWDSGMGIRSHRQAEALLSRIAPETYGGEPPTDLNEQEQSLRDALLTPLTGKKVEVPAPVGGKPVGMWLTPQQQQQRQFAEASIQGKIPSIPMVGDLGPLHEQIAKTMPYGSAYYGLKPRPAYQPPVQPAVQPTQPPPTQPVAQPAAQPPQPAQQPAAPPAAPPQSPGRRPVSLASPAEPLQNPLQPDSRGQPPTLGANRPTQPANKPWWEEAPRFGGMGARP